MLPVPFEKYIPQTLRDQLSDDAGGQALVNRVDTSLRELREDTLRIEWLRNPEQCPSKYLNLLAEKYAITVYPADSDRVKRIKIKNAIKTHRNHGLFEPVVKPLIDTITGLDSFIYKTPSDIDEDEIFLGDGDDEDKMWSVFGGDGVAPFGFEAMGDDTSEQVAGVVWIALTNNPTSGAAITDDMVDEIKRIILLDVPAYFVVYLGYVDADGYFIMYTNPIVE